jgi:hypothetical protein
MITKFKMFENVNKPEIGDYVIIDFEDDETNDRTNLMGYGPKFINKLIDIKYDKNHLMYAHVIAVPLFTFKTINRNLPDVGEEEIEISKRYIKYWSKNKEELKLIIKANKYNL